MFPNTKNCIHKDSVGKDNNNYLKYTDDSEVMKFFRNVKTLRNPSGHINSQDLEAHSRYSINIFSMNHVANKHYIKGSYFLAIQF